MLTADGVHMNVHGNIMMATGILKGFGLTEEQLHKAHQFWLEIPNAAEVNAKVALSIHDYERLSKEAEREHKSVQDLVNAEAHKAVESLLKSEPGEGSTEKR